MFGINWNVSVRLVQRSHPQRSKVKGYNVFKSLEISCLQRRVGASGKWYPALKRCNYRWKFSMLANISMWKKFWSQSEYLKKCNKRLRAIY